MTYPLFHAHLLGLLFLTVFLPQLVLAGYQDQIGMPTSGPNGVITIGAPVLIGCSIFLGIVLIIGLYRTYVRHKTS